LRLPGESPDCADSRVTYPSVISYVLTCYLFPSVPGLCEVALVGYYLLFTLRTAHVMTLRLLLSFACPGINTSPIRGTAKPCLTPVFEANLRVRVPSVCTTPVKAFEVVRVHQASLHSQVHLEVHSKPVSDPRAGSRSDVLLSVTSPVSQTGLVQG
ncbi:hypothetical protein EDB83DRAFT_2438384, partial [Lactarius deliciosus]